MPRKAQTKERFTTISIEMSLFEELHRNRLMNEPLYQTARRMFHKYKESDQEAADFMLQEYKNSSANWKDKYFELLGQRSYIQSIERFI